MPSILDMFDRPHRGKTKPQPRTCPCERIAASIEINDSGCWIWRRHLTGAGYGTLKVVQAGYRPLSLLAHRASYELHNGPIPAAMVLDHLCRNRACVNPDHLEPVVQRENVLRSPISPAALNAAKTHCPQSHEYSPENTYIWRPTKRSATVRKCRTCHRESSRAYNERKRVERSGVAV